MDIETRRQRIMEREYIRLEPESELTLWDDLKKAKTHKDLDEIEDLLEGSEATADEDDLFDD